MTREMTRKKTRIPIFFASDNNYLPYLTVTLASIEEFASDDYIYDIRILTTGLSEENENALKNLNAPHLEIRTVNPEERVGAIREALHLRLRDYYSESIFYRLFIPSLFPDIDRAIYLDCDIVLREDIAKMYFTDIGDNILGAVADESIPAVPEFCTYVDEVIGSPAGVYFNSGVLLINARRFREEKVEEKFLKLLETYNFPTVAPDQDYLNYICRGKVYFFGAGWNKQPKTDSGIAKKDIFLIHYNMFEKPWLYYGVLYEEYFWDAAQKTPFFNSMVKKREAYTEEKKRQDLDGARRLVEHCVEICNKKCSFCHVIGNSYFEGRV